MIALRGQWRHNYPMSKLSTWRVGGLADELFMPADLEDMLAFYNHHQAADIVIGHGSNLLVRDGGIAGVVVRTAPGLMALRLEKDGGIYVEAGVGCPKLARFAAQAGFIDAVFLVGIPGTVGGALTMNAGCEGSEIWAYVEEVLLLEDGKVCHHQPQDFIINYRSVEYAKPPLFFIAARLRFIKSDDKKAQLRLRTLIQKRNESQPIGQASCGSVFRNPPDDYAGRLIESCGLKGMTTGGAKVSEKHANFIINNAKATAADIEQLINEVRQRVKAQTGISLTPEVRIIGRKTNG